VKCKFVLAGGWEKWIDVPDDRPPYWKVYRNGTPQPLLALTDLPSPMALAAEAVVFRRVDIRRDDFHAAVYYEDQLASPSKEEMTRYVEEVHQAAFLKLAQQAAVEATAKRRIAAEIARRYMMMVDLADEQQWAEDYSLVRSP